MLQQQRLLRAEAADDPPDDLLRQPHQVEQLGREDLHHPFLQEEPTVEVGGILVEHLVGVYLPVEEEYYEDDDRE